MLCDCFFRRCLTSAADRPGAGRFGFYRLEFAFEVFTIIISLTSYFYLAGKTFTTATKFVFNFPNFLVTTIILKLFYRIFDTLCRKIAKRFKQNFVI